MMSKKCAWLLILLVIVGGISFGSIAQADEANLLVLCDVDSGGALERCYAQIRRYISFSNRKCDFAAPWEAENLEQYNAFIVCVEEGRELPEDVAAYLRDGKQVYIVGGGGLAQLTRAAWHEGSLVIHTQDNAESASGILIYGNGVWLPEEEGVALEGEIHVGADAFPLTRRVGKITHLAVFDDDLSVFLVNSVQSWLWPYANMPTSYGQYLVLDNLYPFYDPEELMEISDMLMEENVPFAVSVMPIYDNAEFPSMKRFCEYLRYLQGKGVGIILRTPLISLAFTDSEDVRSAIEIAYSAYSCYGVYPVALEAPEAYISSEEGMRILAGTRTVFLFETDEVIPDRVTKENLAYREGHQLISPSWSKGEQVTGAYAQAIYLDVNEGVDALRTYVERLKASKRVLKSLNDLENILYIGDHYVYRSQLTGLMMDNKPVDLNYYPFVYEEDYQYERGFIQRLTEEIENSNHVIMGFVLISCSIFAVAILLQRRLMRRQILKGMALKAQKQKAPRRAKGGKETSA